MVSRSITDKEKTYMNDKFLSFIEEIYQLKDENGNDFSYAFHALPLRANIEYYKVIKSPMSYSKIKMAAKHKRYTHPQAFINELVQISWNARFFNEESSEFYKFAVILNNFIKEQIIPSLKSDCKIFANESIVYPNLGKLPNDLNNEGVDINEINKMIDSNEPPLKIHIENPNPTANANAVSNSNSNVNLNSIANSNSNSNLNSNNLNSTPIPDNDDDDDYEENNQHDDGYDYRSITNQQYNPNSYAAKIEEVGKSNMFQPSKNYSNHIPNRQILEQWVKRGRPPIVDKPHEQRIKSIMRGLKKIKIGNKTLVSFWDKLPLQQEHPDYLKVVKDPITMLDIKSLIKQRYYKTVDSYVADVFKLINNNRNYFVHDEFIKNNLNILESNISRLYQVEMSKPDVEFMSGHQTSKFPLSEVTFNNRTYKVGNWILINNINDPLRPTVAQIFRLWQQEDGELCMNVCWYYRPEWTVHRVDRLFLENEVFKTGQYRDHLVSEILGPCYVAYFTRWLKGDPGIKFDGPLFVCEFRYNDRENTFAKIRTWKACLPDEVRHLEDPIKPLIYNRILKKFPSPIKQLLLPGSTSSSPIQQPIILNLNSPPLVGSVYIPRDTDEIDLHYFDLSLTPTQCKIFIPPTSNIRIPTTASTSSLAATAIGNNNNAISGMNESGESEDKLIPGMNLINMNANHPSLRTTSTFKSYSKPPISIPLPISIPTASTLMYPTSHKIIKSPYNLTTYSFSQYHSPSTSFTFLREGGETEINEDVVKSYLKIDKFNLNRINKANLNLEEGMLSMNNLIWFRAPPLKISDRILNDEVYDNTSNGNAMKRVKCGHSAEYLSWKLKKQKKNINNSNSNNNN